MGNSLTLEFAGDATKLQQASRKAVAAVDDVAAAARDAGADMKAAEKPTADFTQRVGQLGAGVSGMTDAVDSAAAAVQGLADLQSAGAVRAQRLARAANDVKQATEDMAQATRDSAQAAIDAEQADVDLGQARLDQATALKDYNTAVKEHGAASDEAKQAQLDMAQAGVDVKQAQEDAAQATRDASQANIDGEAAQLDLNEAMLEAHPPALQAWADDIGMVAPLLSGLIGVVSLVTAAQWAWNAAQLASPTVWIIAGIAALVAIIVLIAAKTDWFARAWNASWGWIKDTASNVWEFIKGIPDGIRTAFEKVSGYISAPFRAAFNFVADAWNNTVGSLSWTVPGWVPFIGGNTVGVPNLPHFHQGGTVPGPPGSEMLAVLEGGETVTPASGRGGDIVIRSGGTEIDELLVEILARAIGRRGGNVQRVLGGSHA